MNSTPLDFDQAFTHLTGNPPFPWQQTLYRRFIGVEPGGIPSSCTLPTGLGKTSVVAIWLLALTQEGESIPRRLVYVVNRRTVVDQTTNEVEKYRVALQNQPELKLVRDKLAGFCALPLRHIDGRGSAMDTGAISPLALSTLRGQFADNREWSADPARPAVIVGTVDMIGSRLLFSGYCVGFKGKPLHAGFLGQDVLLVHDEAHLEPAFQELIGAVEKEQMRCREFRPFRVMELSATSRGGKNAFVLTDEERNPPPVVPEPPTEPIHVVWRRQQARKVIHLHPSEDEKKLSDSVAKLASTFADSNRTVLVILRKVDDVEKVVSKLRGAKQTTQQLTGTLRGLERDKLPDDPIFRRFLPDAPAEGGTAYLICTAAGEVGVNISSDHLVCDLSTFDSMAQRFGRVNRLGNRHDSEIHVFHPSEFDEGNELDRRRSKTLNLLKALKGDGSPKALGELDPAERLTAFAPTPTILPTSDILFDAWALTTIRSKLPGRPSVEPYLHGISEWELPETRVAWRDEVWVFRHTIDSKQERKEVETLARDLLEDYPLKPHELLRDRSDRILKHLTAIAAQHPDYPVWLLEDDGSVSVHKVAELANKDRKEAIHSRTILLPPDAGGLAIENAESRGMFNGSSAYNSECRHYYDVADEWTDAIGRRRVRLWNNDETPEGMRLIRAVEVPPTEGSDAECPKWNWYERLTAADGEGSKVNRKPVAWQVHTDDVTANTERIVAALLLSDELRAAFVVAAKFHDLGKKRLLWQRSIGNPAPTKWLAKSGGRMKPLALGETYRHEFGSLVDLLDAAQPHLSELRALSNDMRDMVLHLIAVHHGLGRPHFPTENAFDPQPKGVGVEEIAAEVARRFARLQRKYGRWGLAYLESLLRAADWAASAHPSEFVEVEQ